MTETSFKKIQANTRVAKNFAVLISLHLFIGSGALVLALQTRQAVLGV